MACRAQSMWRCWQSPLGAYVALCTQEADGPAKDAVQEPGRGRSEIARVPVDSRSLRAVLVLRCDRGRAGCPPAPGWLQAYWVLGCRAVLCGGGRMLEPSGADLEDPVVGETLSLRLRGKAGSTKH